VENYKKESGAIKKKGTNGRKNARTEEKCNKEIGDK
jgi:hypothetical protein